MSEEPTPISGHQYLGGLFVFLYRAVRSRLPVIIVVTLLVAVLAYFATPRPALIYGAQVSVENGRVAGAEPMSLQATVARVNGRSFKRRLLQSMNLPAADDDRASRLLSDSLTAKPESSGTATVNIRGSSEQQVRQALDLVVRLLNQDLEKVSGPMLADINAQLAESDANIASLTKARESLLALTKAPATDARPESQADDLRGVLVLDLLSRNENTLIYARADRRELASRLGSWNTYPMAIADDVLVSPSPGSPRPSRIALLAGTFTFAGFLLYALMRGRKVVRPN
jgi:hypothetical protein